MAVQWNKIAARIDKLIRAGKSALVVEEFHRLRKLRVPRELVESFANLSYRAGVPEFGIRILNPYVRSETKDSQMATSTERAEYAYGLIRVGAPEEATEILKGLGDARNPKVDYYQACALIARWNYAGAVALLEKYIEALNPDSYDRIVGEVNLASAYVYECEVEKAGKLLGRIIQRGRDEGLSLVLGKALQLQAENSLTLKDWEAFDAAIVEASKLFQLTSGRDRFFLSKLCLQKELATQSLTPELAGKIKQLRSEAKQIPHYESVRDCDRLLAVARKNVDLFLQVYFGTPHLCYRERLVRDFGRRVEIPERVRWQLTENNGKVVIDVSNADCEKLPRKLLAALCRDFYAPMRVPTLHHHLYPGEFFNPVSSPARIHRAIRRLREWLAVRKSPVRVIESNEFYSLQSVVPAAIEVPLEKSMASGESEVIDKIIKLYPERPFSIAEASKQLDIPVRTLSRYISKCVEDGSLVRVGSGAHSRYAPVVLKKTA